MSSTILLILVFFLLILLKMPISITMIISVTITLIAGGNASMLYIIPQQMIDGALSSSLLAIPFFIFAANMMNETGLTDKIFNFASSLVGHIRGGLAQVNVVASMIFGGCTGAAVADAAGLGVIEIKAMKDKGYPVPFSAAITSASSSVGPIIPPSIPMVIYGVTAGVSIGRLFLGGIIPGIIIGLSLIITNWILSYLIKGFPAPEKRSSASYVWLTFKSGFFSLLSPIIIVGGLVYGYVTASEAGILASLYALLVGIVSIGFKKTIAVIPRALVDTMINSSVIMFIISAATPMGWVIAMERIPFHVAQFILSITENKQVFLLLLNLFLLLLGTILAGVPALLISIPIFAPIAEQMGVDPVHFGLVIVYGILIGGCTPPMGVSLYIMTKVAKVSFIEVTKAMLPFLIPLIIVLLIITYVPQATLLIPRLLMGP